MKEDAIIEESGGKDESTMSLVPPLVLPKTNDIPLRMKTYTTFKLNLNPSKESNTPSSSKNN